MRILFVVLIPLLVAAPAHAGGGPREFVPHPQHDTERPGGFVYWHDDLESGAPGWTHGDASGQSVEFHIDTYLAYEDPYQDPDYSWWCGVLDPTYSGGDGYGNSWDQRLELPPLELGAVTVERTSWGAIKAMYRESAVPSEREQETRSVSPILTFRYRYDCELGYDYCWVEAESLGEWVVLNGQGWDGKSEGWQDLGSRGYLLSGFDDPLRIRFRFTSDAGWSDADGYYQSDGGAFHVDDIRVYDALTSEVYFREDCEGGAGQCQPATIPPGGDYWHLVDDACQAYNGTHLWSASWPDSGSVPPGLQDWLMTPVIDVGYAFGCTLFCQMQMFMSGNYGGSWQELGSTDGGATWTRTGWWYGHQCQFVAPRDACKHFESVIPLDRTPGHLVAGKLVILTDSQGNACDVEHCSLGYCSAGITLDDFWITGYEP